MMPAGALVLQGLSMVGAGTYSWLLHGPWSSHLDGSRVPSTSTPRTGRPCQASSSPALSISPLLPSCSAGHQPRLGVGCKQGCQSWGIAQGLSVETNHHMNSVKSSEQTDGGNYFSHRWCPAGWVPRAVGTEASFTSRTWELLSQGSPRGLSGPQVNRSTMEAVLWVIRSLAPQSQHHP